MANQYVPEHNRIQQIIGWLAQQGVAAYLVGGCVRDRLLGRPVYDLDVVVDGDGLVLARRLANHFQGDYYALDKERSTGRAILLLGEGKRLVVDVARLRGPTLAADLADRDFTINALAIDLRAPGEVIDLHHGLVHLQARLIHPVSPVSIHNDPVRILRAVRLAAELGFELSAQAEALIQEGSSGLARVSGERIRDELARLLALPHSASSLIRLDELGLLTLLFPELEPLRGLGQPPPHYLDALSHSLETVRALETLFSQPRAGNDAPSPPFPPPLQALTPFTDRLWAHLSTQINGGRPRLVTLKLTALLHDVGKPATCTLDMEGRPHFRGHHIQGTKSAAQVLQRLRFAKAEVHLGEVVVRNHMRPLLLAKQESVSSSAVYRFFRDTREAGIDVLIHALADHQATYAPDADEAHWFPLVALTARMLSDYWEHHAERVAPPPLIDGYDLLREFGLQPGPHIGELLETVREAQASGQVHTREEALELIRKQISGE